MKNRGKPLFGVILPNKFHLWKGRVKFGLIFRTRERWGKGDTVNIRGMGQDEGGTIISKGRYRGICGITSYFIGSLAV